MADEQLKVFVDVVTNRAVSELKKLKKSTEDTGQELEDTRTEAQKVADRIDKVTQAMVSDMKDAEAAADALAMALGPEMSSAIGRSGITEFVSDLKRAGLSAKDVEADAERLAQTLKNIDQAKAPLRDVDDHIRRLGATTDNSRSVFANFTGNAIQELPGITGAMGPLNMAIGQFAEYAVDGNIKMANFLKTAGGIGAAVIGIELLGGVLESIFSGDKDRKATTEAVGKAVSDLTGDLLDLEESYIDVSNASVVMNQALLDNEKNGIALRDALAGLGISSDKAFTTLQQVTTDSEAAFASFAETAGVSAEALAEYARLTDRYVGDELKSFLNQLYKTNPELKAYVENFEDLNDIAADTAAQDIAKQFLESELAAGGARAELVKTAEALAGVSREADAMTVMQTLLDLAASMEETAEQARIYGERVVITEEAQRDYNEALADSINKHRDLAKMMMSFEGAQLAVEDEYENLIETQNAWGDGVDDNAEELRNLRQAQLDVAESVIDLSLKKLEANGIDKDSAEGVQAQIDELKRLQDQYPLVKGEIQKYIDELLRIPGTVNTNLTLNGRVFGQSEIVGPGGTSMTPTNPGGTNPGSNPGGTTIIVNGALDPVAVADQIDRMMRDYNLRNGNT